MLKNLEARRLALVFAIVYCTQGMFHLPDLSVTFLLKDTFGLNAAQAATFFSITMIPWLIKPVYGLISDTFPFFGLRRKGYFLLTAGFAAAMGFTLGTMGHDNYWAVVIFFTLMGLGIAFMDVLTDAWMVENGQRLGLTGSFQAIQWAAICFASILAGVGGGWLAQHHATSVSFLIAGVFPVIALLTAIFLIKEPRASTEHKFRDTWRVMRRAGGSRMLWTAAGFIFFFNFSPSFGPALAYYSTDVLHFSKVFLGTLDSLSSASGMVGAALYFAFAKAVPFKRLLHFAIAAGVIATLAYLGYLSQTSALVLAVVFGGVAMFIQLIFLELAAMACPRQVEGTFFALLMAIYNGGSQLSQITGGWLYDHVGFTSLIFVSAGSTALCWFMIPLLNLASEQRTNADADNHPVPAGVLMSA
jgi:MFS family permease